MADTNTFVDAEAVKQKLTGHEKEVVVNLADSMEKSISLEDQLRTSSATMLGSAMSKPNACNFVGKSSRASPSNRSHHRSV